jgi:hypothetical protein
MDGFWGWAFLMVFAIALTASLVVGVVRVLLVLESFGARRAERRPGVPAGAAGGPSPERESLRLTPEQSQELDAQWASLVDRLR